jgi:hypothetical protein
LNACSGENVRISILRNWQGADLSNQWPANPRAEFAEVNFEFDAATNPDHVVILNAAPQAMTVNCPPDRIWAMIQEPPTPYHVAFHDGQQAFSRIYTTSDGYEDARHVTFWGALEWHVERSYDQLVGEPYPEKTGELSWITSNQKWLAGHQVRMRFLRKLQKSGLPLDLWGRGFTSIDDKWSGLAPYRYSVAFENFSNDLYWTEKLTDCFLAYTTPFYYGARTIDRYFPPNSYIPIDPDDPHVFRKMQDHIAEGFHQKHLDALLEARDLCLNKYNTLFFIAREVLNYQPELALKPAAVELHPASLAPQPRGKRILDWLKQPLQRLF